MYASLLYKICLIETRTLEQQKIVAHFIHSLYNEPTSSSSSPSSVYSVCRIHSDSPSQHSHSPPVTSARFSYRAYMCIQLFAFGFLCAVHIERETHKKRNTSLARLPQRLPTQFDHAWCVCTIFLLPLTYQTLFTVRIFSACICEVWCRVLDFSFGFSLFACNFCHTRTRTPTVFRNE